MRPGKDNRSTLGAKSEDYATPTIDCGVQGEAQMTAYYDRCRTLLSKSEFFEASIVRLSDEGASRKNFQPVT